MMPFAWMVFAALAAFGVCLLIGLACRWLTQSWEILDDDTLNDKLGGQVHSASAVWLRLLGWLTGGPRRLTYRRDERGRFRKIRR